MEFRYPKARLFAYNKLAAGDSCYSVMIQAVSDAGLVSADQRVLLGHDGESGGCGALQAAEKIIREFMHERHDEKKAEELSAIAFNQIQSDLDCWKESKVATGLTMCGKCEKSESCRDMTPVVLDFLLQQIMRH